MRAPFSTCLVVLCALSCDRSRGSAPSTTAPNTQPTPSTIAPVPSSVVSETEIDAGPPHLESAPLLSLAVAGFGDAIVSVPVGTTRKRPVLVAVHGNYDRPEWQCQVWRAIVGDRGFVLCPRGVPRKDSPSEDDIRFTFESGVKVAAELDADRAALVARFPDWVDDGPIVYTGFSLGAITGVAYLLRDPAAAPRAVLTEGSHDRWTFAAAQTFASKGGQRVLFACGQPSCVSISRSVAKLLNAKKVESRVVHGEGVGHGYDGKVADAIASELEWLLEGDPRWDP
jgi:dienelactone hydrolase